MYMCYLLIDNCKELWSFGESEGWRERISDTIEKVKYIPEPVREQLDATVSLIVNGSFATL